jgi:ABC-2 type transport system permease protein
MATQPATASTVDRRTVGFGNVLVSEWTKLRSVRSTYWTAIVAVLATIAIGALICHQWEQNISIGKDSVQGFDAALTSLNGIYLAQVAVGALGVLVISSEYGTGMIRATLGAVPQRRTMLAAKGLVFAVSTLVVGEILSFGAFAIGQAILSSAHANTSLSDPGVLRATIGGGLYLTAVGLLGFGLGALIRHTAGALSAFFGVLFASTALVDLLPTDWRNDAIKFMPANAGSQIITVFPDHGALGPWTGFAVLSGYAFFAIAGAAILITRRDA